MAQSKRTFLAIEAHADDATLGAGAVLIEAARRGHRVVIVTVVSDFATWQTTVGREARTRDGLVELADRYGFERIFLDYPYHQTRGDDLDLKRKLARIHAELKSDVALIHHHEDHWPDHAATARASHDALLFPHGLSGDLGAKPCPTIYSFDISPRQTFNFQPDAYFDVTHMIQDYIDLIRATCNLYFGRDGEQSVEGCYQFVDEAGTTRQLKMCPHALRRFAECARAGNIARCRFALGLKTVWAARRIADLF